MAPSVDKHGYLYQTALVLLILQHSEIIFLASDFGFWEEKKEVQYWNTLNYVHWIMETQYLINNMLSDLWNKHLLDKGHDEQVYCHGVDDQSRITSHSYNEFLKLYDRAVCSTPYWFLACWDVFMLRNSFMIDKACHLDFLLSLSFYFLMIWIWLWKVVYCQGCIHKFIYLQL